MAAKYQVGDIVRHTGKFLRSIGMQAGAPINGKIVALGDEMGDRFVQVLWCDRDETAYILTANIEHDKRAMRAAGR